ncbi:PilZ domain-containing protein [Rhizorhapis sp.]|uniref:PilZ domain-containing protein n=1 Tax=Rhizorhapis sp. TaxID=1968842 RepID=UPI002B4AA18C|nr:PilZ domain-containing protein [Rhizorhapis sp.]HKR18150.1 PilZ domain-containing protein [Rhizorhapis sp.]
MSMINHQTLQDSDTSEEHRRSDRQVVTVRWVAKMTGEKGQELCLIRNISTGGVMANIYSTHEVGEQISLEIRSGQQLQGEIVWMRDGCVGIRFLESVNVDEMLKSASVDRNGLRTRPPRIEVYGQANIKIGDRTYSVDLCDLSQGGVKVTLPEPIAAGNEVVVSIGGLEDRKSLIRWQKNGRAGLSFVRPISFDLLVEWLSAQLNADGAANVF